MEDEKDMLGGCIIYNDSVLCSQMDESIMKWVLYRCQKLSQFQQADSFESTPTTSTTTSTPITDDKASLDEVIESDFVVLDTSSPSSFKEELPSPKPNVKSKIHAHSHVVYSTFEKVDFSPVYVPITLANRYGFALVSFHVLD